MQSSVEAAGVMRWSVLIGLSCGWAGWGWLTARLDFLGRPILLPLSAVLLGAVLIMCARRGLREPVEIEICQTQPHDVRACEELVLSRLFRDIHPDAISLPSSKSKTPLAVFRTR